MVTIDQLTINQIVEDKDGDYCQVTNKTINSVEVFIKRKNKNGIDSKQWFNVIEFNSRFNAINF